MNSSEEDRLVWLKEMVILMWISDDRIWDLWIEHRESGNDEEWTRREGLVILLTEEMVDLMVDKSEHEVWEIFDMFICSSSLSSHEVQCSLVRLCTSVSDRVSGDGWKGLRVLCWVMRWMVNTYGVKWSDETIDCVVNYLVKVIEECEEIEMVKWAILTGEKWWVEMKMKMNSERRDRLRTALTRHSQTHSDTLVGEMDRLDLWDTERYQVGWCARWCADNLVENELRLLPLVKLSRDRLEARCQSTYPVRSPFPVKSNVYFYEVICVTNGEIQVGWSTREARFDISYISSENGKNSVMLQVDNQCAIYHNYEGNLISNPPSACPLSVFGCLLDVDNRRFEFYINGRALDFPIQAHFSPPYFATVKLTPNQQCHFNFGQLPFKFPPQNIRYTTFHKQTRGDERKYRLGQTETYRYDYYYRPWFAHSPVDNQVSLFFDDEMQNEVNREVRRVEGDIENDRIWQWKVAGWNIDKRWTGLRYIQAIIEVMGNVEKMDVMAQWVGEVIEDVIDKVYKEKLLELLYPYVHLYPRGCTKSNLVQHRSICIVLLHLIKCCRHHTYKTIQPIHSSVFTYLTRTLTSSLDHWTQLFVLIALADLELNEHEKRQIEGCAKIGQIVETGRKTFEGKDVGQLIKLRHEYRLQYQLFTCSFNLLKSSTPSTEPPTTDLPISTLNPNDISPHLTLSPCHLSARSDWHWQSVRSVCQVSAHIYYFEVVLLTAGPMTLGWATKRTDLTKINKINPTESTPIMIGFDEYSIGFDGFNRCIYHDNKTYQLENIPRWKAGDIVGCLIDPNNKYFQFYLNGIQINFDPTQCQIYFSSQPYHSILSLSPFQQVYLNFGQFPFSSNRPKYIDFYDFYSNKLIETQTKTIVNFNSANLNQNLIAIDANINQRDVTITDKVKASTSKSFAELTESIGDISSISAIANVNIEQINNSQIDEPSNASQCYLCKKPTPNANSRLRFDCCDHMTICHDCAPLIRKCPIHK